MGVAHLGLVYCDPCECKVKSFRAVSSIERNVSKGGTFKGCDTDISVLVARRYEGSCDIISVLSDANSTKIPKGMDTSTIQAFSKNGPFGRWTITCGKIVTVTLAGLYCPSQGRVVAVSCRDLILVQIVLLESSPSIEGINLSFPERGLELLSDCVRQELIWEAQYLRPYTSTISDDDCGIGGPLIPVLDDEKPVSSSLP